jgi:hypothetical protein
MRPNSRLERSFRIVRLCRRPAPSSVRIRRRRSLLADERGAVAFETLIVYSFMLFALLFPLGDLTMAGYQFVSAWAALRGFGQLIQYHGPSDPTSPASWISSLPTSVSGYPIKNVQVLCGGATCTSGNVTTPPKTYSYTTTVTLTPMVLGAALCGGASSCSFTLPYSERFQ